MAQLAVGDFREAAPELEKLRSLVQERCSIARAPFTPHGGEAQKVEYRFELRPRLSVYVRAPITRTGRPRKWGRRWEFNIKGGPKHYRDTAEEVTDWMCAQMGT